jgi:hypothetical protein
MVPSFRKAISQGDSACWKLSALTVTAETELTYIIDDAASSVKAPIFDETEIVWYEHVDIVLLKFF